MNIVCGSAVKQLLLGSMTRIVCENNYKNFQNFSGFVIQSCQWMMMMMTFRPGPALMTSDDCVATVDDHTGLLAKFCLSERYW